MNRIIIAIISSIFLSSCMGKDQVKKNNQNLQTMITDSAKQYGYNVNFLKKYIDVIELKSGNSSVAIVPGWQGRVMTSTSEGIHGFSFGWINHKLISSGEALTHINPYGGEERLWLGPEGGQYSIFFKEGDEFIYDKWQTPAFLDTIPFRITAVSDSSASFSYHAEIENYSGTSLNLEINRQVTLLSGNQIMKETGIDLKGINFVAYRSENRLTNKGANEWKKESGLLSIWMLGMFIPSPAVMVVIPVRQGDEKELGVVVNDNYFGKISEDRLKISGSNIYFRADGKSRGKIGITPRRASGIMGSYDFENNILTLLICKLPEGKTEYVNSAWQIQDNPYSGDALNSYNDGPLEDRSQMGPFYELETSAPAAALKPGESITHSQVTIHLTGDKKLLSKAAVKSLGVSLDEIEGIFK
ncbi:MAG: hypothetical protein NTY95_05190 [Bacteroidia bacterium]|nr:hypothetical protein [Bacteroidia bacterium]